MAELAVLESVKDVNPWTLRTELEMEKQKNAQQAATIAALDGENQKLRKAVRWYRERNMKAYAEHLRGQSADQANAAKRIALYAVLPVIGAFAGTIVTLAVCFGRLL